MFGRVVYIGPRIKSLRYSAIVAADIIWGHPGIQVGGRLPGVEQLAEKEQDGQQATGQHDRAVDRRVVFPFGGALRFDGFQHPLRDPPRPILFEDIDQSQRDQQYGNREHENGRAKEIFHGAPFEATTRQDFPPVGGGFSSEPGNSFIIHAGSFHDGPERNQESRKRKPGEAQTSRYNAPTPE